MRPILRSGLEARRKQRNSTSSRGPEPAGCRLQRARVDRTRPDAGTDADQRHLVVILLEDTLTKGEKQSVAKGHADAVSGQTRRHSLDPATRLQRFNRRRGWAGPDMAKRMTWTVNPVRTAGGQCSVTVRGERPASMTDRTRPLRAARNSAGVTRASCGSKVPTGDSWRR